MNPGDPRFLDVEDVLLLHRIAIDDQRGDPSLRDSGLLESAVMQPRQQFGGAYLHEGIPAMAAAYAFHICKNHPFVDGNKRAALAAMVAFLINNDWRLHADADEVERTMLEVADGSTEKQTLTSWVASKARPLPSLELRKFFNSLTFEALSTWRRSVPLEPEVEGWRPSEWEAAQSIPYMRAVMRLHENPNLSPDQRLACEVEIMLLTAIFRLAEDMGYEW